MLFDPASKVPPELFGFDGADVAGKTLDTEVTEGISKVLDVSVLRVVAMLMGACTIDGLPIEVDMALCGSTLIEDGMACDEPDDGWLSDTVSLYGDTSPLEAEASVFVKMGWGTDVVKRVTITGDTEDTAGLGAKLGC